MQLLKHTETRTWIDCNSFNPLDIIQSRLQSYTFLWISSRGRSYLFNAVYLNSIHIHPLTFKLPSFLQVFQKQRTINFFTAFLQPFWSFINLTLFSLYSCAHNTFLISIWSILSKAFPNQELSQWKWWTEKTAKPQPSIIL